MIKIIKSFSIWPIIASILIAVELVIQMCTRTDYTGVFLDAEDNCELYVTRSLILVGIVIALFLGDEILVFLTIALRAAFVIKMQALWPIYYDYIRLLAYAAVLILIIYARLNISDFRKNILRGLALVPGYLMTVSFIWKFIIARLYLYLQAAWPVIIMDLCEVAAAFIIGIWLRGKSETNPYRPICDLAKKTREHTELKEKNLRAKQIYLGAIVLLIVAFLLGIVWKINCSNEPISMDEAKEIASIFVRKEAVLAENSNEDSWHFNVIIKEVNPLYSPEKEIIAYHIRLSDVRDRCAGYVIVGADSSYAPIIEYSTDRMFDSETGLSSYEQKDYSAEWREWKKILRRFRTGTMENTITEPRDWSEYLEYFK